MPNGPGTSSPIRSIGSTRPSEREAILAAGDGLRLSPDLPSDVGQFEDAIARGEDETAVALYAGPFLDGFFVPESAELERWIEGERRRLADEYRRAAVERLAESAERAGDWNSGGALVAARRRRTTRSAPGSRCA